MLPEAPRVRCRAGRGYQEPYLPARSLFSAPLRDWAPGQPIAGRAPTIAACLALPAGAAPGPAAAATATAAAAPAPADAAKLTGMEDAYHPQLHMPELDDDCLRLLLGDDADESAAAAAATQGGTPAAPTPPGSGNASEKSSACHGEVLQRHLQLRVLLGWDGQAACAARQRAGMPCCRYAPLRGVRCSDACTLRPHRCCSRRARRGRR